MARAETEEPLEANAVVVSMYLASVPTTGWCCWYLYSTYTQYHCNKLQRDGGTGTDVTGGTRCDNRRRPCHFALVSERAVAGNVGGHRRGQFVPHSAALDRRRGVTLLLCNNVGVLLQWSSRDIMNRGLWSGESICRGRYKWARDAVCPMFSAPSFSDTGFTGFC